MSAQCETSFQDSAGLRSPSLPPTEPDNRSLLQRLDTTTTCGVAVAVVISFGTVWGWLLVQLVQIFFQPTLTSLREQVAGMIIL